MGKRYFIGIGYKDGWYEIITQNGTIRTTNIDSAVEEASARVKQFKNEEYIDSKMKLPNAFEVCNNIRSDKYTREEKIEAIRSLWRYVSRCSLTKPKMVNIIAFLLDEMERQKNENNN